MRLKKNTGHNALVDDVQWNFAPFLLSIEHQLVKRDVYRVRAHIKPRSRTMAEVLQRHRLLSVALYEDAAAARSADEAIKARGDERRRAQDETLLFAWTASFWWAAVREVAAHVQAARVPRVSVGELMDGVGASGSMQEMQAFSSAVAGAVDRIASLLAQAIAFEEGQIKVIAPGVKPGKAGKGKDKAGHGSSETTSEEGDG